MDHLFDKMDHLFDHFRQYCIFSENYWNKIFMMEFPYKWIRFEAFLFLFELFQIIRELSVWGCVKGNLYTKCTSFDILYLIAPILKQVWSYCVYAAIATHTAIQQLCSPKKSRQMVTPTLLRPRTTPKEPECNVSLERLAFIATTLWRIQWQAQVHVVVGCVLWRQGQAVAGQPPQSLRRILVVIWTFLCTRLANKPGPWERICRPLPGA